MIARDRDAIQQRPALAAILLHADGTESKRFHIRDGTAIVRNVSMSWVTTVPNGMSAAATTVGSCVGGALGPVWPGGDWLLLPRNSTTTNVSAARKMPSSRTSRLVRRTRWVLPGLAVHVTGGTTLAKA